MDEVKAMTRAGENMGKAVGTGIRSARVSARRAGEVGVAMSKQAAAAAEQELANHGISTDDLQEQIAQRVTGKSRKQLRKQAKIVRKDLDKRTAKSRKQLAKNTKIARKELAARLDPPKRRKWPWVLLVLAGLGAAAAAALSRRPEEMTVADAEFDATRRDPQGKHRSAEGEPGADGQVTSASSERLR